MPTSLGRKYTIEWRGRPPHLLEVDCPVWWRFLENHRPETLALYYDVMLGGVDIPSIKFKDPLVRDWYALTAKRVDAVIETPKEVFLIEIATHLRIRAIGQALSYQILWSQDPKIHKLERPVLVGEDMDLDLLGVAGKLGITVYLV